MLKIGQIDQKLSKMNKKGRDGQLRLKNWVKLIKNEQMWLKNWVKLLKKVEMVKWDWKIE